MVVFGATGRISSSAELMRPLLEVALFFSEAKVHQATAIDIEAPFFTQVTNSLSTRTGLEPGDFPHDEANWSRARQQTLALLNVF